MKEMPVMIYTHTHTHIHTHTHTHIHTHTQARDGERLSRQNLAAIEEKFEILLGVLNSQLLANVDILLAGPYPHTCTHTYMHI
jgi:hypothetical protein